MNPVYFLSGWDVATRTVSFANSELSPYTYNVADSVDVSGINQLLNRYVLVTMEQGDSVLEYTVTDIQPVESKIGTVSATSENSLTIDGKTYTTSEMNASIWGQYEGKEVLYHTVNEDIKDLTVLEEKIGTLEAWDRTTGKVTIDGIVYPTYDFSDLSFVSDIDNYMNKQYYYMTAKTGNYTVFCKITEQYYPGGDLADFDATIYQATWLSKGGNAADILNYDTPSDIIISEIKHRKLGDGGKTPQPYLYFVEGYA